MKITESNVAHKISKSITTNLGNIYFFNHIAVIEFNEGVHLEIENSADIVNELVYYFGNSRPFGVVANRVNSYSINLLDVEGFKSKVKNLAGYAVVGHNKASLMNAEIENNFCANQNISYDNIYEALDTVYSKVKLSMLTSLN